MARETKTQVWTNVQKEVETLLNASKVSAKFKGELLTLLEAHLAPKGGSTLHPPKEVDGALHYWCRFYERYLPEADMVMSKGKSKGYSKSAISRWNKANSSIKELEGVAVEAMGLGDFDKAQKFAKKAKELKDTFNKPEYYDYTRDSAEFKKPVKSKTE